MEQEHANFKNCGAYDFLRDMRADMQKGLDGINDRLDAQNGRVRSLEIQFAEVRGRAVVIASVAAVVSTSVMAMVLWLVQRGW